MLSPRIHALACVAFVSLFAPHVGAKDDADPEAVTRRVADAIIRDTSYGFRDRITGRMHPRAEDALVNTDFRVQSPYTEWHYPNGVIAIGMLALAPAVDDARYADYAAANSAFIFDNIAVLRSHYGAGRPWVEFQRYFRTAVLDDCGAMGAGLYDVDRTHPRDEYAAYFATVSDHMLRREHRLADRTFCRPSPRADCIWADDLYMSVPFLARMGQRTGEAVYFDDAVHQVERFHHYLWNEARGLYHHGYWNDEKDVSIAHWGRANGWILMAKVELLKHLPVDHPKRATVVALLLKQVKGLAARQDASGLWHQLLDRPDSFLETSASAMFTYGIARAVNDGWIHSGYRAVAEKAWQGMVGRVTPEGRLEGVCEATGLRNDVGYYLQRTTPLNDRLGLGAFLLAGTEMIRARHLGEAEKSSVRGFSLPTRSFGRLLRVSFEQGGGTPQQGCLTMPVTHDAGARVIVGAPIGTVVRIGRIEDVGALAHVSKFAVFGEVICEREPCLARCGTVDRGVE